MTIRRLLSMDVFKHLQVIFSLLSTYYKNVTMSRTMQDLALLKRNCINVYQNEIAPQHRDIFLSQL